MAYKYARQVAVLAPYTAFADIIHGRVCPAYSRTK